MKKFLPPLIPFVVITLVLEWMVRSGFVPSYLVPAPLPPFSGRCSIAAMNWPRPWPKLRPPR